MVQQTSDSVASLYEADETAWLDSTSQLLRTGRWEEVDTDTLAEYLEDTARRDRREVESRLAVLLTHILKWGHQPDQRSRSWKSSIVVQRQELISEAGTGVLRNHAESVLGDAYRKAVERAAVETGLSEESFPVDCRYSLDELMAYDPNASE